MNKNDQQFMAQKIRAQYMEKEESELDELCKLDTKKTALRLHHLNKTEHFVRTFIGITLIVIGHLVVGCEILTPKLVDLKAALVDVEMDIALLKIGCAGLPNLRFRVQSLNRLPRAITDALCVLLGGNEQNLQLVVMCFLVDPQDYTANTLAVDNDAVGLAIRRVDRAFDRFA